MRRYLILALLVLGFAFAQQDATVSGVVQTEAELPNTVRVGIRVIDLNGNTLTEVSSSPLVAGTFSVSTQPLEETYLAPFRSGVVPLPGLHNEYGVSPEEVNYARAILDVYADNDAGGSFNAETDERYLGIASLEAGGFFILLYVDQDTSLSGRGSTVELALGWNIFTARTTPEGNLRLEATSNVDDVVLDIFAP